MASFRRNQNLSKFQELIAEVYTLPDDRLYSVWDLVTHQQRFTMRALKGIRKKDLKKTKLNLMIAFAWQMATANRLHINLEEMVWKRFPALCSYCGKKPCSCKESKVTKRHKVVSIKSQKPNSIPEMQKMFDEIYQSDQRTAADAGVHLAEEMGEVSEAVLNYLGQHQQKQFDEIKEELADYVSCFFGVANSLSIDIGRELEEMFYKGCHVCHLTPCVCDYTKVAQLQT